MRPVLSFPLVFTSLSLFSSPFPPPPRRRCCIHGDGSARRNYVYVDDVVHAFDAVLHRGVDGEVYNIGTSFEVDMLTLARMIVMAMGLASPGDNEAADEFIEFVEDRNINDRRCVSLCLLRRVFCRSLDTGLQVRCRALPLVRNGMESVHVF